MSAISNPQEDNRSALGSDFNLSCHSSARGLSTAWAGGGVGDIISSSAIRSKSQKIYKFKVHSRPPAPQTTLRQPLRISGITMYRLRVFASARIAWPVLVMISYSWVLVVLAPAFPSATMHCHLVLACIVLTRHLGNTPSLRSFCLSCSGENR